MIWIPSSRICRFNPRTREGCDALMISSSLTCRLLFQSTHPRGVRLVHRPPLCMAKEFQSTHPRGVRLSGMNCSVSFCRFQSTHPRGVRRGAVRFFRRKSLFQSTHPRGVRPPDCTDFITVICFNPRTREGWDIGRQMSGWVSASFQSTHPRGVRLPARGSRGGGRWFQSTHPRGVRRPKISRRLTFFWFQSTHPRGVRPNLGICKIRLSLVSIHAPARGATWTTGPAIRL